MPLSRLFNTDHPPFIKLVLACTSIYFGFYLLPVSCEHYRLGMEPVQIVDAEVKDVGKCELIYRSYTWSCGIEYHFDGRSQFGHVRPDEAAKVKEEKKISIRYVVKDPSINQPASDSVWVMFFVPYFFFAFFIALVVTSLRSISRKV